MFTRLMTSVLLKTLFFFNYYQILDKIIPPSVLILREIEANVRLMFI